MTTYTTSQGDMWDSIAHSQLGDCIYADKLLNANQAYRNIFIFSAGIVLTIPNIDAAAENLLPPWKRGHR